tara:strand:- start:46 stop:1572 length:1527 start_codon:yes stop_codon:yes gene_type:complete
MAVRRDSLRARSDFFSPMTGNTSGTRFAGERRGSYTEEAKRRLQDLDTGRTDSPVIEAIKVALEKTPDPFTKIPTKKSYAPEEDQGLAEALGGLGGSEEEVVKAVGDFIEPIASGGSGQRAAQRRADQQYARQEKNPSSRTSTNELVARDNRMYGNTFPKGSMGSGSQPGPAVDTRTRHSEGTSEKQPEISKFQKPEDTVKTRTYYGQGGLKLGTTTQRQGGTVKDGKKVEKSDSPAVNLSNYQDNRDRQNALRTAAAQQSRLSDAVKATGIPTGLGLKAGSFGISQAGRDQAAINKGIAAAKKTGIPSNVAVQGGAMSQAARDQAAINRGIAAAKATGIPSGDALKAGSFGISEAGRLQAAKNKAQAQAKAKAQAAAKTSSVSTTTKQGVQRTKAQMAAAKRKASGTTSSQARASNQSSMRAAAAARHASFKKAKAAGTHARTASAQRARNRAAAKARAKAAAKRRRSKKKCDITIKYDISKLTSMNLLRDDLANVAYFVKELQETI